jgi:hypothetical protein
MFSPFNVEKNESDLEIVLYYSYAKNVFAKCRVLNVAI